MQALISIDEAGTGAASPSFSDARTEAERGGKGVPQADFQLGA